MTSCTNQALLKEAYFFDLDGTLINTTPDIATAINLTRTIYDLPPLSLSEVEAGIGWGATELIIKTFPSSLKESPTQIRQHFIRYYEAHLCDQTQLYPGVHEVLECLKVQKRPMALVTNKPLHLTYPILETLHLTSYFQSIVGGDSFPQRKPHPQPLLESMSALNLQADHVLFVGDTEVDFKAAQNALMDVAIVPYGRAASLSPTLFNWSLLLNTLQAYPPV
jgi:phosphoglycolate phosphatase